MEKKSGKCIQPLSKGLNFDKKNQDNNNNGRVWTKGANRRESASGSLSVKPEATRKNQQSRSKSFDKRPKPRGGRPDVVARDEASCLDEQQVEVGSVFQPGSKKQSLNHLLNFTYAPRNSEQQLSSGKRGKCGHTKKHKYVKEHFLQANCQFVVNESGDYKQYLNNPDALVEWNYIEQINVQVNDPPFCPICLHTPMAAKITRCGHIYCWCCILHYLSLTDKPHHKCPICYESVFKEDLKSVVVIPHQTFIVGEEITFKLMKRNQNSLTPYPAEEKILDKCSLLNSFEEKPIKIYSKLLLAKNSDILTILKRELIELKYQLEIEEESERCFIEEAIIDAKKRESSVSEDSKHVDEIGKESVCEISKSKDFIINCDDNTSKFKDIYFYQASDGQHIYIHSFNVRMLKHTYGSLEFAPNTITSKILAKESDSMSEDYRKCYKYLAHLPVTCSFDTVEIELNLPTVNQETLNYFKEEISKRKKQRAKKEKEEMRREKIITEEENIKIFKRYPETHIPLESQEQFPNFGSEFPDVAKYDENSDFPSTSFQEKAGPSFAKMAAASKTSSNPWPDLKTSSALLPLAIPRTVNKMNSFDVISGRRRYDSSRSNKSDQDENDRESAPEHKATFGDAIVQALQKAAKNDQVTSDSSKEKGGKKKKKSKQKILLSTSLGFSGT